jgi:hypothetical protein
MFAFRDSLTLLHMNSTANFHELPGRTRAHLTFLLWLVALALASEEIEERNVERQ